MNASPSAPVATPELHRLIRQARQELKRARENLDPVGVVRSERRMNQLLDILCARMPAHRAA